MRKSTERVAHGGNHEYFSDACLPVFIGATLGWVLELLFRRLFSSANPERKWINPGFCVRAVSARWYGCGLCFLYLIASLEQFSIIRDPFWNRVVPVPDHGGVHDRDGIFRRLIALKGFHVRLWDYSKQWGNIPGSHLPKIFAWRGPFSARRIIF